MLYPLTFHPRFKERIWGGRKLEELYGKALPPNLPIGESWEIADRPGDASVVAAGPLAGRDLRWLMENHSRELLGSAPSQNGHFPLLIKILDAQATLSLQVHPPAAKAAGLGGEPKTEMWYVADASPGAELFVGLRRGITRTQFEQGVRDGSVADCFHRVGVRAGDAMFLPSGRVHALGAGMVIFEVQQNSDTTYRVFDWNRVGADGRPRALHVQESLASIDFDDFEPGLANSKAVTRDGVQIRSLVRDPLFTVEHWQLAPGMFKLPAPGSVQVLGVTSGVLAIECQSGVTKLSAGQFCLVPAVVRDAKLTAEYPAGLLYVQGGISGT